MKLIPLGTNGFFPTFGRQTACFAIPMGTTLIILDAGSGLFRLAESEGSKLLAGVSDVHIFLSHYHLDHTFGFYSAFKLLQGKKVTVYAESDKKVFADLAKEYFPIDFGKEYANFNWKKLEVGENNIIDDYKVNTRKQYHRGSGSLAFKFKFKKDKVLSYATDNEPTWESIEFIKGSDLLLHEHYLSGDEILGKSNAKLEEHFDGKHTTTVGAAIIAKEAQVGKLALIHHYPFYDNERLEKQLRIAQSIFSKTVLAKDLESIEF